MLLRATKKQVDEIERVKKEAEEKAKPIETKNRGGESRP